MSGRESFGERAPAKGAGDARETSTLLADLSAAEVVMLGHALRMVPSNAVLTGDSATQLGGSGVAFFTHIEAYKTLWNKVAAAISQRDDVAPYRTTTHGTPKKPRASSAQRKRANQKDRDVR